jgi:hypothetical protein
MNNLAYTPLTIVTEIKDTLKDLTDMKEFLAFAKDSRGIHYKVYFQKWDNRDLEFFVVDAYSEDFLGNDRDFYFEQNEYYNRDVILKLEA